MKLFNKFLISTLSVFLLPLNIYGEEIESEVHYVLTGMDNHSYIYLKNGVLLDRSEGEGGGFKEGDGVIYEKVSDIQPGYILVVVRHSEQNGAYKMVERVMESQEDTSISLKATFYYDWSDQELPESIKKFLVEGKPLEMTLFHLKNDALLSTGIPTDLVASEWRVGDKVIYMKGATEGNRVGSEYLINIDQRRVEGVESLVGKEESFRRSEGEIVLATQNTIDFGEGAWNVMPNDKGRIADWAIGERVQIFYLNVANEKTEDLKGSLETDKEVEEEILEKMALLINTGRNTVVRVYKIGY